MKTMWFGLVGEKNSSSDREARPRLRRLRVRLVAFQARRYARMLDHTPTFVTRTLPSGCPRTDTLSSRAAAYKPERNRLRLRSSMPMPGTSKC